MPRRYEVDPQGPFYLGDLDFSSVTPWALQAAETAASVTPSIYSYLPYDAHRYGFSTSDATGASNATALQNCINAMAQAITSGSIGSGYPVTTSTGPEVFIPDGIYNINAAISLPSYCKIRANNVILVQTTAGTDHFTCTAPYRIDIEGICFHSGRSAINFSGPNTDTTRMRFARCDFQTGSSSSYAVSINCQTGNFLFEDCKVLDNPLFLDTNGDYVEIRNCWVNSYLKSTGLKPNSTASVNNRARIMRVMGGSWVGEVSGSSTSTRWFNNQGGLLVLDDVQFGAENSGLPIVYEYGSCVASVSPFTQNNGVIVRGGQLASGASGRTDRGVVVLQGAVPSVIDIRAGQYVVFGKIINDAAMTAPTLASWLTTNVAGVQNKFMVTIENVSQEPTSTILSEIVPSALLPFCDIRYGVRGSHPGYKVLPPLNNPLTEYKPDWTFIQSNDQTAVCGQKLNFGTGAFQDAILVTKSANLANGLAGAVVIIDVVAVALVAGVYVTNQAQFRVTLIAGTTNVIGSVVSAVITQDNAAQGGAGPGNVLGCQVAAGATTTACTIQLRFNAAMTIVSMNWSARLLSTSANNGGAGYAFTIASA